jgi:hypothetical protein
MDGIFLLGLGLGALGFAGAPPEPDESWRPRLSVSVEDDGSLRSFRRTSLVLNASGTRRDDPEWLRPSSAPAEEPNPWRDTPLRLGVHPWDVVVGVEKTSGPWGWGVSGVSVTAELLQGLLPLGTTLNPSVILGLNVDLLGFEDYESTRLTLIDRRHGSPRFGYFSIGPGLTIKF